MARRSFEPYTDAELDAEIVRTQRSDWTYVLFRAMTLAVVFSLLARAILVHGATAGYLLLPLAAEIVTVMWVGLFLSYFVVDCPSFAKTGRRPIGVVLWTLAIGGVLSAAIAWDSGSLDPTRIGSGWAFGWQEVWRTGLVWALVAEVLGLLIGTAPEVVRWRRVGGVFVWNSIFGLGMRMTVALLLGVVLGILLIALAESFATWVFETPQRTALLVFGFLLAVEIGGLALGALMHRDLKAEAAPAPRTP